MPSLNGFRDFYPEACAARQAIFTTWREVAQRYGFVEYDGPILEPLELFTKKAGGAEITGQLYNFIDKGERAVSLRPEMTPTLARLVTERHRDYRKPLKWYSIPQVFRYERPQRGRGREHYQLNCDIVGEPGLEADIELIALAIDVLRGFGLTEADFVVRLSDRVFWNDFLDRHQVPEELRTGIIQAIDKSEREPREKTAAALGALAPEVFAILEHGAASARLDFVEQGLARRGLGAYLKRDFTVVRGLAYYTGLVFEVFDRSGEFRAIAGGGRYDRLLQNLGGVDLPALGFGLGDMVLGELLRQKGLARAEPPGLDLYIGVTEPDYATDEALARFIQAGREAGLRVDYAFHPASFKKLIELAEHRQAAYFLPIGAAYAQGRVTLRHLKTRTDRALETLAEALLFLRAQSLRPGSESALDNATQVGNLEKP